MIVRVLLIIFLLITAFVANAFVNPIPLRLRPGRSGSEEPSGSMRSLTPVQYGVSWSFEHAEWYGMDSRAAYIKLLDEVKVDWVRIPFFWDRYTKDGELNLEEMEFAIKEAAKRDVDVIVALGLKTPYWPEYHLPTSRRDQIKFGERVDASWPFANDVLAIDRKIVEALSVFDNVIYWQVENEPLIGNINKWKIDASLVGAEVDVVRAADPAARPIILNHAAVGFYDRSWKELLPILSEGDVFAVNAFFKTKGVDLITAKILGREIHILWPQWLVWPVYSWGFLSPNFESIKATVEANGNRLWVLEMQAEPYVGDLEAAAGAFLSFTTKDIADADKFLRSYEIESIGLWGAHFWQYKQEIGDGSWMNAVGEITAMQ